MGHVGIGAYVGWVLAPQFQANSGECARQGLLHLPTAGHRPREVHLVHTARTEQCRSIGVTEHQVGEQTLRQPCRIKGLLEPLTYQQRLRGVLEQHRIAGHEGGHDGVDGGEKRIVPRGHHKHQPQRYPLDEPLESILGLDLDVRQRRGGDVDHVQCALREAAQFTGAVSHRPSHLPCQLDDDLVGHGIHGGDCCPTDPTPFFHRRVGPVRLGRSGPAQCRIDLRTRGQWPFGIHRAVDGRDDSGDFCVHIRSVRGGRSPAHPVPTRAPTRAPTPFS